MPWLTTRDTPRTGHTGGKAVCQLGRRGATMRSLSRTLQWVSQFYLIIKLGENITIYLLTLSSRCATDQQEGLFHQGGQDGLVEQEAKARKARCTDGYAALDWLRLGTESWTIMDTCRSESESGQSSEEFDESLI